MKGRIAVCHEPKSLLEIQEYEVMPPSADQILVRISSAGVCGSDLHMWHGEVKFLTAMPAAPGHEMTGQVVALGSQRTKDSLGRSLHEGDRVVYAYFNPCGECWTCVNGDVGCPNRYAQRSNLSAEDSPHFLGAYGDYYYVNGGQWIFKVPDSLPDRLVVPVNCAVSQVIFALNRAQIRLGDVVVIQGLGGLGIYACGVARDMGAGRVIGVDSIPERLALAREFGADATIDLREIRDSGSRAEQVRALSEGRGADVVLEVTGVPDVLSEGIAYLRPGGRYVLVGIIKAGATTSIVPSEVVRAAKQLIGVVTYDRWTIPRALDWLDRRQTHYPFEKLVADSFPLDRINDAFAASDWAASQGMVARSVIDMDSSRSVPSS